MTEQDPLSFIAKQLETKLSVKQVAYRNLCDVFEILEKEAHKVISQIRDRITSCDEGIAMEVVGENGQEFHMKIGGDLLVFIMHTNIITLDKEHGFNKSDHVAENTFRRYLGQINVYNFMVDSFKYNRLTDPGFLLARLFVNCDRHFMIEGERQLGFMFDRVSEKPITDIDLNMFIKLLITQAIESDLIAPSFPEIRTISLHQKIEKTQALGGGVKIGFQMKSKDEIS
ncbi:hypothetical protein FNH22_16405 [Fulvivirga sp. M361]|uniref:hypothetical protein n=1 Tax=Fulvivirga sp. M361 TaxID=2594266 RepID=UPI00117BD9D6|nr:hypothetical protein [Fulvivirga sp. M361]TRX56219.1 hypothetical protein FNH22_16405 [Fulvivirga sp. M361]